MNPLRGQAEFEAGGEAFLVQFDWNAAAAYESAAGRPISEALLDLSRGVFSATSLRAMFWAGLRRHHQRLSIEAVGRLMDELGRTRVREIVNAGMRYYFPELEDDEAPEADPPTPAASA